MESHLREIYKILKTNPCKALELAEELYSTSENEQENLFERLEWMIAILKAYHEAFISNKALKYE